MSVYVVCMCVCVREREREYIYKSYRISPLYTHTHIHTENERVEVAEENDSNHNGHKKCALTKAIQKYCFPHQKPCTCHTGNVKHFEHCLLEAESVSLALWSQTEFFTPGRCGHFQSPNRQRQSTHSAGAGLSLAAMDCSGMFGEAS